MRTGEGGSSRSSTVSPSPVEKLRKNPEFFSPGNLSFFSKFFDRRRGYAEAVDLPPLLQMPSPVEIL
jgi:hypothetical protein